MDALRSPNDSRDVPKTGRRQRAAVRFRYAAVVGGPATSTPDGAVRFCVVSLLTVVTLRRSGVGADALVTARALVAFHDWIFLLGQGTIPAVNALLLGSLLYRSRLAPRALPVLGFIGAALLIASVTATLF